VSTHQHKKYKKASEITTNNSFRFQARSENVIRRKIVKMLRFTVAALIVIVCAASVCADKTDPVVCFGSGCVRGKTVAGNLKAFDAFLGIPYAKKPINELRLKVS
jgi:hypothetical protein